MSPANWPPGSKPYFMIAFDTSGSMGETVSPAPASCPGYPATRLGHARCALKNMINAYAGQVNFGLATFPIQIVKTGSPAATCPNAMGSDTNALPVTVTGCGISDIYTSNCGAGASTCDCGNGFGASAKAANLLVPMMQDDFWNTPSTASANVSTLLGWVDNQCGDCKELFSRGFTPLNGILRDMYTYLSTQWVTPVVTSCSTNANCTAAPAGSACISGSCGCAANADCTSVGPGFSCVSGKCTAATPLQDATKDRSCRQVNVILMTDGQETCDPTREQTNPPNAPTQAQAAAAALLAGWNIGSAGNQIHWSAKTYVVAMDSIPSNPNIITDTNAIAASGGTGQAYVATNETAMATALSTIISASVLPEVCDNSDNNCNGCIDEGSALYCNRNKTARSFAYLSNSANNPNITDCCDTTQAATSADPCITALNPATTRDYCLDGFKCSSGKQWFLPCWDPIADSVSPESKWLCSNPGDPCDTTDNNCETTVIAANMSPIDPNLVDENAVKCGSPAHCPGPETCNNGVDDNCDGIPDNTSLATYPYTGTSSTAYSACPGGCQSSTEICDGCDNDCSGTIDDNVVPQSFSCGFTQASCPNPNICQGTQTCDPVAGSVTPGSCLPGGPGSKSYTACTFPNASPTDTTCDNCDDDCNGVVDDGALPVQCDIPPGTFPSFNYSYTYGGTSQCQRGSQPCHGTCSGYVGPSQEICDGIDNDCDGVVDDNVTGVGAACGSSVPPCTQGNTACVLGKIVCQGGTQPQPESCNGIDDDCDGSIDNGALTDATGPAGCWSPLNPGGACTGRGVHWDPPANGTCTGVGTLTQPCKAGSLQCLNGGWQCVGALGPSPEVCDTLDNNCNGSADEGNPGGGGTCGNDVGICVHGTAACVNGVVSCTPVQGPIAETCNNADDDCDGTVDNNILGLGQTCGVTVGVCQAGVLACNSATHTIFCQGEVTGGVEVCNGLDDDCNGAVDDGPTDAPADLGCWNPPNANGACSNSVGLSWDKPDPRATCTGAGTLTTPCYAGTVVCFSTGPTSAEWRCLGGQGPGTEVCDGSDNDCDGVPDDGNPGGGATCGPATVGECQSGTDTCVNGQVICQGEKLPSAEICDNKDNDCDGTTDGTRRVPNVSCATDADCSAFASAGFGYCLPNAAGGDWCSSSPGSGSQCVAAIGICSAGTSVCIAGQLVCQRAVGQQPEVCNGLDDDCDGTPDNNLTDAPTDAGCWNPTGASGSCGYLNLKWDPIDSRATCTGLGTLTAPCAIGTLACDGANGWKCVGGDGPTAEICDGEDNDCNGTPDDGNPGGGAQCGTNVGECEFGTRTCQNGRVQCLGGKGPQSELLFGCNGKDDDCDGTKDNGIQVNTACAAPYDTTDYPGDRTKGLCRPGKNQCPAGGSGQLTCVGGVGPTPEVCDGQDNDCDGRSDELGPAPDGINGTEDPNDPTKHIGDKCGSDVGQCKQGVLGCVNGRVQCTGEVKKQPIETCDCEDNNCNGQVDENPPAGSGLPPVCSGDAVCVKYNGVCQCAVKCGGEFPCVASGTDCHKVAPSAGGPEAPFCVSDTCKNCPQVTGKDPSGKVACGPAGTTDDNGLPLPECVCKGLDGCRSPCFGVQCDSGFACVSSGQFAGNCEPQNNCNFFPCKQGDACHGAVCVDDPCDPNPCKADEVCRPNAAFDGHECVKSCANVVCKGNQKCEDGTCVATGCAQACTDPQVCLTSGKCGASLCITQSKVPPCSDGSHCDPATGTCGNDPCSAVKCPAGQDCSAGNCFEKKPDAGVPPDAGGGSGGAGGAGGSGGTGGSAGSGGSIHRDGGTPVSGGSGSTVTPGSANFGLATGGGGCACGTAPNRSAPFGASWGLAALAIAALAARRRGGALTVGGDR